MQWILGPGAGIEVSPQQLEARRDFIKDVTSAEVSSWGPLSFKGVAVPLPFLTCTSKDGISGVFITAHADGAYFLCEQSIFEPKDVVIINSCLLVPHCREMILKILYKENPQVEVFFAEQETFYPGGPYVAKFVTISDLGEFGFQTSISERKLFRNRKRGLINAINASFDKVY